MTISTIDVLNDVNGSVVDLELSKALVYPYPLILVMGVAVFCLLSAHWIGSEILLFV